MATSNPPAAGTAQELARGPARGTTTAGEIDRLWRKLHDRGEAIAAMAALAREPFAGALAEFPLAIRAHGPAQLALATTTLDDLLEITAPGLAALENIAARGQDTTAPALALWREFHAARAALLALAFAGHDEG